MKNLINLNLMLAAGLFVVLASFAFGEGPRTFRKSEEKRTESGFTFDAASTTFGVSDIVTFGLVYKPNDTIAAVAYPNFAFDSVRFQNLTFIFTLPAGTNTLPAISPNTNFLGGGFGSYTGNTFVSYRQEVTIAPNPAVDVYAVRIQGSFLSEATTTDSVPLFWFRLPTDCNGGFISIVDENVSGIPDIVVTDVPELNEITLVKLDNGIGIDTLMYGGNEPDRDSILCPINLLPMPIANDDVASTNEDNPVNLNVLSNDNFGSNGPSNSSITIVTNASKGTGIVNNNSTPTNPTDDQIVYTPQPNFFGLDSLTYRICDAVGNCDTAKVRITINSVDDGAIAANNAFNVSSTAGPVTLNVLANDTIPDGVQSLTVVTQPAQGGTITIDSSGPTRVLVYNPVSGFSGTVTFTYQVCDVDGDCDQAVVTLTINDNACLTEVSCLNSVVIPLDINCSAVILPSMVMGGLDLCDDQITIVVNYGGGQLDTNFVDRPGFFSFTAFGPKNEVICMGTLSAEDKIDPQFCCEPTETYEQFGTYKKVNYNTFSGRLDGGDPRFRPSLWSCWQSTNAPFNEYSWPGSGERIYDTIMFKTSAPGTYSFFVGPKFAPGSLPSDFSPVIALFAGTFDGTMPCENIVGFAESTYIPNPLAGEGFFTDGTGFLGTFGLSYNANPSSDVFGPWLMNPNPVLRLSLKLEPSQIYTLVITSKQTLASGAYDLYAVRTEANLPANQPVLLRTNNQPYTVNMSYHYYNLLCGDADNMLLQGPKRFESSKYLPNYAQYSNPAAECTPWNQLNNLLFGVPGSPYSYEVITGLNFPDSVFSAQEFAGQVYIRDVLMLETSPGVLSRKPFVIENCDNFYVDVSDRLIQYGDCGYDITDQYDLGGLAFNVSKKIERTFVVHDYGKGTNPDSCQVDIYFRNPSLLDVILPHYTSFLECDEFAALPASQKTSNGYPSPQVTGYPFVETAFDGTVDLTPTQPYCNLAAGYEDKAPVEACDGSYKFRREWTIYDWCRPGTSIIYNQLIKVGDFTAPTIVHPVVNQVGMSSFDCYATGKLPMPQLIDNCSGVDNIRLDITVSVMTSTGGTEEVAFYPNVTQSMTVPNLQRGEYIAKYEATDACGNKSTYVAPFEVVDNIAPMAMCDDVRNISLSNINFSFETGTSWVPATSLDEGSRDNCYPVIVRARRALTAGCSLDEYLEHLNKSLTQALGDSSILLIQGEYFTNWLANVPFWCCDVKNGQQDVKVEMMAYEDWGNGQLGLSTKCWMWANVEDKTLPICFDMPTTDIYCSALPQNPKDSLFWELNYPIPADQVFDNCNIGIQTVSLEVDLDVCGGGTITRVFRAGTIENGHMSNLCTYTLRVVKEHDYTITFPADDNRNCSVAGGMPDSIQIEQSGCDMVLVSTHDERFTATGDECYKIFRTYRVMNWCEYDGNGEPYIVRRDENCDGVLGNQAVSVIRKPRPDSLGRVVFIDKDKIHTNGNPGSSEISTGTPCWHDPVNINVGYWRSAQSTAYLGGAVDPVTGRRWEPGFWQYTQVIKVYDNQAPSVALVTTNLEFKSTDVPTPNDPVCGAKVNIQFRATDLCNTNAQPGLVRALLSVNNSGNFISYEGSLYITYNDSVVGQDIPLGSHTFRIMAGDGCGNTGMLDIPFTVVDAKAPSPICLDGLAVELMPVDTNSDGTVDGKAMEVWGSDFISGNISIVDCSDSITYYIKRAPIETPEQVISDSSLNRSIVVTCADRNTQNNPMLVYVIAEDEAKNRDYCITRLWVQDNINPCVDVSSAVSVAGMITTEEDLTVQEVEVFLSGMGNGKFMTNNDGQFKFQNLPYMGDFTVVPRHDKDPKNGVTTFDLVMINKHILGVSKLNSPYKMIAADVNKSGSISTVDLIQIRQLILGIRNKFDNNTSWRFINKNYVFPNPANPWAQQFPEIINFNDLDKDVIQTDFVAIKVGDVNSSAKANDSNQTAPRSSYSSFEILSERMELKKGMEYRIPFTAKNLESISGYQFTLNFDKHALRLNDVIYGLSGPENFGMHLKDEGIVTTSWNKTDNYVGDEILFTLVFVSLKDQQWGDFVKISSEITSAEAYNETGDLMDIKLVIGESQIVEPQFELMQNAPNPFTDETLIRFYLPNSGEAVLNIQDASGKRLLSIRRVFDKGLNAIRITKSELQATGILYYTLITPENTATRKMIITD